MARDPKLLRKAYETKLGKDLTDKLSDAQIQSLSNYYNRASAQEQSNIDSELVKGMGDFLDTARQMAKEGFVPDPKLNIQEYKKVDDRVEIYNPGDKLVDDTQEKLDKKLNETSDSIMNEIDKLIAEYQKKIDDYKKPQEEKVPEGLDDLLKDIRGEVGGDTSKKGGALAVISKPDRTKQETLVGDDIDPEILSALGIGDATDLDYGEYSSLLKEKMVANQMGSGMGLDQGKLRDEFKRVKGKTGRFTVKNQKIKAETFVSNKKKPSSSSRVVTPIPLLPGQVDEDIKPERQSFDKTIALLAGKLNSVDSNVRQTTENLQKKDAVEAKQDEQDRVDSERAVSKEREDRTERRNLLVGAVGGIKKAIKPVGDMLGGFFDFFKRLGFAVFIQELLEFLQDPKKYLNGIIKFINKQIEKLEKTIENFVIDKLVTPINSVIGAFNQKVKEFTEFVNPMFAQLQKIGINAQFKAEDMMIPSIDSEAIKEGFDLPSIPTIGETSGSTASAPSTTTGPAESAPSTTTEPVTTTQPKTPQVSPQTPAIPTATGLGRQGTTQTADYGPGSGAGPKGYIIVPGHAAGGGAPGEMELTPALARNIVDNLRERVGPDVPVKVMDMHAETPNTQAAFIEQQNRLKELENQGYEVIELHMDASIESGSGTGRGVILPMPGTDEINPVEADFARTAGAFGREHRGGLAGTDRGISLIELGNMSPQLQEQVLKGDGLSKEQLDKLTEPLVDSLIRALGESSQVQPAPQPSSALPIIKPEMTEEEKREILKRSGMPAFSTSQTSLPPPISPPVRTASLTPIGGLGGETPSNNATSSSDIQSRVSGFSASDPNNLSILAAKSVYRVV